MTEVLECPRCKAAVTVSDELRGRVMACPHCAVHFTVGQSGPAFPVAAPAVHLPGGRPLQRFTFACARCASILEAEQRYCGTMGRCPTCGGVFTIPHVDARTGLPTSSAVVADDGQLPTPMHAYATAGAKAPKIVRNDAGESVIVCPRCEQHSDLDANQCALCGTPFTIEGAESVLERGRPADGLATAALTISLLGICIPFAGLLGVGLALVSLMRGRDRGPAGARNTMALAGLIVGLITLSISVILFIF